MCVDTNSSPPWQSVTPRIDLSLADVKKSETLPCEAQGRANELMLLYVGHVLTIDGSKTKEGVGCAFVSGRDTPVILTASQLICIYIRTSRDLQRFEFYRSGRLSSTPHFNGLLKQPFGVKEFLPSSSHRTGHHSPSCVPEPV